MSIYVEKNYLQAALKSLFYNDHTRLEFNIPYTQQFRIKDFFGFFY